MATETNPTRRTSKTMHRVSAKLASILDHMVSTRENVTWVPNAPMMAEPGVFQHALYVNGANVRIRLDTVKGEARVIRTGDSCKPEITPLPKGLTITEIALLAVA